MLVAGLTASAQKVDHYSNLQLNLGGGLNTMLYTPVDGNSNLGFGGLFEVQYQLMFNRFFGFGIGVQASCLNSSALYNNFSYVETLTHEDGMLPDNTYDRNTGFKNWKEKQHMIAAKVPVQLMLRIPTASNKGAFQMGLGATFDIPVYGRYNTVDGTYSTTGYFPGTNVEYSDLPNHGFSDYNADQSGNIDYEKFYISLLADLGWVFNLSDVTGLYVGLYGNYGMNNVIAAQDQELLVEGTTYNGTFASNRVDKVIPLEAGLKIGLRFGMCKPMEPRIAQDATDQLAADAAAQTADKERLFAEAEARVANDVKVAAEATIAAEAAAKAAAAAQTAAEAQAAADAAKKAAAEAQAAADDALQAAAEAAANATTDAERVRAEALAQAAAKAQAAAQAAKKAADEAQAIADAAKKAADEAAAAEAAAKTETPADNDNVAADNQDQIDRDEANFVATFKDIAYFETAKTDPINFKFNEAAMAILKKLIDKYADIIISIVGHADNVGSASSNMTLSKQRANTIKDMMVNKGINASRIKVEGKGDTQPAATNDTEEGRALNRRAEITISRK